MLDEKQMAELLASVPNAKLSKTVADLGLPGRSRRLRCFSTAEAHPKLSIMEKQNG
jgi:hypothetical protein